MDICQENRVFLLRNGKILLFKHDDLYDGDCLNIERYVNKGSLRYIAIEKTETGINQTFYYFANTTDQYLTQYGEWVHIEEIIHYPAKPITSAILENYYSDGQYTTGTKVVTKNEKEIKFTAL